MTSKNFGDDLANNLRIIDSIRTKIEKESKKTARRTFYSFC
jgi:hypothetical protein